MFCIIYKSTINPEIEQSKVFDLLKKAKKFNRENNITGCLLYYNSTFVQYIEGDKAIVTDLFDRIKKDHRHSNVDLLSCEHIYNRKFKDWGMAYESFINPNYRLAYLKLLVSCYVEDTNTYEHLNPTTNNFWIVAKTLLENQKVESFN